jgi:hypothetical protein
MKKTITITAIVCTLFMNAQTKITYPETKKSTMLTLILAKKLTTLTDGWKTTEVPKQKLG